MTSILKPVTHVTRSGVVHPYFAVSNSLQPAIMYASITCHPPLGYPTVVPNKTQSVSFNVIMEASTAEAHWEVVLWHNFNASDDWQEVRLRESTKCPFAVPKSPQDNKHCRRWFTAELHGKPANLRPVSFTVKFRSGPDGGWKWVRDHCGLQDGQLYYQSPEVDEALSTYLPIRDPGLHVQEFLSESPGSRVWSVTGPAVPAHRVESGYSQYKLDIPLSWSHWFAVARIWRPWIAPRHGKGLPLAEKEAIMYAFLRTDGLHVVLLGISGIDNVLTTFKYEPAYIIVSSRNDSETAGVARFVVAVGKTFESANAAAMYLARKIVRPYISLTEDDQPVPKVYKDAEDKLKTTWIQDWYDGIGFCTWNSLGPNLTEDRILDALALLKQGGIHISSLIIDDNWQSLDNDGQPQWNKGWADFEANKDGFPKGLAHTITKIRTKHPQIAHVAVWHALLGYWGGISKKGKIAKRYRTVEVEKTPTVAGANSKMLVVAAEDVPRFYNDFYDFLSSSGITAVKTDSQFMLDEFKRPQDRRTLTNVYYDTWNKEQLRHFYGRAISCMSQTPPIIFRCQLPTITPSIPVRNSDDFFPDVDASHPWHIFCNAHNSVFTQHLNVLPDWDMFQTDHKWAAFHAAGRCVSGGPIYITDEPGKHNFELIQEMTAKTTNDQTIVLRPSTVGRSTQVYAGYEEPRLVKVSSWSGTARDGSGFLGIFNCTNTRIAEIIPLLEFPGTENGGKFVLKSHNTGIVSKIMSTEDPEAIVYLDINGYGSEILTASTVLTVNLVETSLSIQVANLGLMGKITGAAGIISSNASLEKQQNHGRLRFYSALKALGTLGVWVSNLDALDLKDDLLVTISGIAIGYNCVSRSKTSQKVILIDLERAWKEGDFQPGYSNEVHVEIFINVY